MSLKYDYSGFHARAKRNLPIFPEFRFPKNVHSPIPQADRQNSSPFPDPLRRKTLNQGCVPNQAFCASIDRFQAASVGFVT